MATPTASCCAVVLNQQQEQNIDRHRQCSDTPAQPCQTSNKNCTVVENGRVVVRPVQVSPEKLTE